MGKIVSVRCGNLTAVARHGDKITLTKPRVFSGAVWSVRCATSVRLPSQRASPAKHLGFFRFRPGFDRQSASANGPAWAALKKHGSQESGLGKRSSRDRCETTNRSVLALVEGPEQACMKVTRAFACIPMNRPPCALGDCMADEQQSWSSPDRVTRLSYG
jgi:hypothetical protein